MLQSHLWTNFSGVKSELESGGSLAGSAAPHWPAAATAASLGSDKD